MNIPKISINIPKINIPEVKVTPVDVKVPKINIPDVKVTPIDVKVPKIPNCSLGAKTTSIFGEMDKGERAGYSDGYYGRTNLSTDKDTVNNEYWLGYSCGYVSGRFDRENGNPSTLL